MKDAYIFNLVVEDDNRNNKDILMFHMNEKNYGNEPVGLVSYEIKYMI